MNNEKKRKQAKRHPARGNAGGSREKNIKDIQSFHKIVESIPSYDKAFNQGLAYYERGDHARAIESFEQAKRLAPGDVDACYHLALAYSGHGDNVKAIALLREVIALQPDSPDAYYALGNVSLQQKDHAGAIALYRQALALKPDHGEALHNLGAAYYELDDYPRAMELFREALAYIPDFAPTYKLLGHIYYTRGNRVAAEEAYREALKRRPDDADSRYRLGLVYFDRRNFPAAAESYRQAIVSKPDFFEAYNNLGIVYENQGDDARAVKAYRKAIELKPDFAEARGNLGAAYCRQGDTARGMELYREALALKPDYAEIYIRTGRLHVDKGDHDKALEEYQKALALNPGYALAYFYMGIAYTQKGDIAEALEMYDKSIALRPDAATYYLRGHIYSVLFVNRVRLGRRVIDADSVSMDWHACVYFARETGQLGQMPALIDYFKSCPRTLLAIRDYSGPGHAPAALAAFEEAERAIADFTALLRWHEIALPDKREVLGMKAILYYHLGGPVPSYVIFDEEMGGYALSARELYYHALSAREIHGKEEAVLARAIDELERKEDKETGDFYYLAHLYFLRGDREKAIEAFKRSGDFIFSVIMLAYLTGDSAYKKRVKKIDPGDIYNFSTSIDASLLDLSRFQHFFHLCECAPAIASFRKKISRVLLPAAYTRPFWEIFRLADGEKFASDSRVAEARHV
jgi:tetratricopeptide (TPR) repeat protein